MSVTLISVSHDTVVSNKHEEQTRHYYVNFQHSLPRVMFYSASNLSTIEYSTQNCGKKNSFALPDISCLFCGNELLMIGWLKGHDIDPKVHGYWPCGPDLLGCSEACPLPCTYCHQCTHSHHHLHPCFAIKSSVLSWDDNAWNHVTQHAFIHGWYAQDSAAREAKKGKSRNALSKLCCSLWSKRKLFVPPLPWQVWNDVTLVSTLQWHKVGMPVLLPTHTVWMCI